MSAPAATGRGPGWTLFYRFARASTTFFCTLFFRVRVVRPYAPPATGACIIVCNHQSFLDPILVGGALRDRAMHPIARLGLFKNRFFGSLIGALNSIPIRENTGDRAAIREGLKRLEQGAAVLIFPEGSRTPDGAVQTFKRGALLLIGQSGCPVLPAAVEGPFEAWPRDRKLPRLWGSRVAVAFGDPIDHDELLEDGPNAALERLQREVEALRAQLRVILDA